MRRFARTRYELQQQLARAAQGIAGEVDWPSVGPTASAVADQAANLHTLLMNLIDAQVSLRVAQTAVQIAEKEAGVTLRTIDLITSGLYGADGSKKISYGLRPFDTEKNHKPVRPIKQLTLSDGPIRVGKPSVQLRFHAIAGATYDVEWYADEALTQPLGGFGSTISKPLIEGLTPGMQIWVRVRGHRGPRYGDWSPVETRIANVAPPPAVG